MTGKLGWGLFWKQFATQIPFEDCRGVLIKVPWLAKGCDLSATRWSIPSARWSILRALTAYHTVPYHILFCTIQYTVYCTVHCILYSIQYTVYCTVYSILYSIVYTVQYSTVLYCTVRYGTVWYAVSAQRILHRALGILHLVALESHPLATQRYFTPARFSRIVALGTR